MTMEQIEPGDFIQSICRKCDKKTKHVVVALVEGVPSKVQCTTCKGNHGYNAGTAQKTTKTTRAPSVSADTKEWRAISPAWNQAAAKPYGTEAKFRNGDLISHPTFGMGLVRKVLATNRMQVLFETGEKLLICRS